MVRQRRLIWKRLSKIKTRIKTAPSINKLTKLLQDKAELEQQLMEDYSSTNNAEEDRAVFNMRTNPKAFFSFARSRQKTRSKIGPFIDPSTKKPNPNPDFSASELSKQYSSVFVKPRPEWTVHNPASFFSATDTAADTLADIQFTESDIERACSELKNNSAAGADGVPATLLKSCRKQLKRPLHILWRSSLNTGSIPVDLLLVLISPVHKGGSRGLPKQYRPVALTSHIIKVFERVIRRALVSHLDEQGLLPDGQHGFRAFRSTLTQLLSFWDSILDQMEEGKEVHAIYLDFAKAFDKVETGVLLHGLKDCKVLGKVACWLASFLDPSCRQQAVVVTAGYQTSHQSYQVFLRVRYWVQSCS